MPSYIKSFAATLWSPFGMGFVVLSYILFASFAMLVVLTTGSQDASHSIARVWARFSLLICGVRVHVEGQEHIPKDRAVVFASNHCSQFDIMVLYHALPVQFRFLAKQELFKVPILGQAMRLTGYIPIDRSGGRKALRSLNEAAKHVASGTSVVVFPEGTRSEDGRLQPFKVGGVLLAIKAKSPLVPVSISGTQNVLPKGAFFAKAARVKVVIGKPVPVTDNDGNPRNKNEVLSDTYQGIYNGLDPDNLPTDV